MKKIAIITIFSGLILSGCLKDDPNVDFSNGSTTVHFINAGLGYFSSDALTFNSDTLTVPITVNLASVYPLDKDIVVTIGVDDAAYNTYNAGSVQKYVEMADSSYDLPETTITIPAGKRIDTLYVTFYKHTFDPAKSYLLPISITDASGVSLTANFNTHYFHVIGNVLAGSYLWDWSRWNAPDSTDPSTFSSLSFTGEPTTFLPSSATEIRVASGYFSQPDYILTFENNNGVLGNFELSLDQDNIRDNFVPNNISVTSGPNIFLADPISKTFIFQYTVSSSGAPRYTVDKYYQ